MGFVNLDTVKRAGIEIFGEGMIETFHNDDEALATVDNGVTILLYSPTGLVCFHQSEYRSLVLSLFYTKAIERLLGMDWYYGCESSDFLVPKDQEDLLERRPSPENWDSVLEDFPCVESLCKSFFYTKNHCSNTTGEGQKDIAASGFVPCNSDSKDCLDIEVMENLNLGDLVGKPYGTQV
ncbi:hypothetical protein JHK87_022380 [Glycine soja]|nr:hypothetical protein JHK87_022380 [Glycine soja]